MTLIPCQECTRDISTAAAACPHCGCPVAQVNVAPPSIPAKKWNGPLIAVACIVVVPAIFVAFGIALISMPAGKISVASSSRPQAAAPDPAEKQRQEEARRASIRASAEYIDYASIARQPTKYIGKIVAFNGKVIQVIEDGSNIQLRVNVTKNQYDFWQDTTLVTYQRLSPVEPRILDSDMVRFFGPYRGIVSYKAVLGQTIQIPHVTAAVLENLTASGQGR